jgi:putative transposase
VSAQVPIQAIAEALGLTRAGAEKRAKAENWPYVEAAAKGGRGGKRREYVVSGLPEGVRGNLLEKRIEAIDGTVATLPVVATPILPAVIEPRTLQAPATLKKWQREMMDARCQLLQHMEQLAGTFGTNLAIEMLVKAAKGGALQPHIQTLIGQANARGGKSGSRTLSRSSLLRWKRELKEAGGNYVALAPKEVQREAVPAWAPYFLKCYRKPQKPSVPDALAELATLIPPHITFPSEAQCYRLLAKMSSVDRERGRCTGNELRALKGFRHRDTSELDPCAVYQCDGHSFKARVAHPVHGKPFHPEVCAVIDAATRMVMGWSAGLSESNQTVADALRHACTIDQEKPFGGIPAIFYTDPGSGNLANVNADPVLGRYARLGITFKTGIVGNSQARGLVERLQQTLWIKAAKQLPTFTGKAMDHTTEYKTTRLVDAQVKKTGGSALMPSWPQFLDLCRQAVERYNHAPHKSLPKIVDETGHKRHLTPAECYAGHLAKGWVPPTMSQAELDDCFRPRVTVTTRRGEVRLFGNVYFHGELVHHGGEKVVVEYAVQDGSRVWVRDVDERLICIAGFESNKSAMFPVAEVEVAAENREKRRLANVERKREEIIEERRGVISLAPAPELIEASRAALEIEMAEESAANVVALPTDGAGRLRLCRDLQRRIAEGSCIGERERAWLADYMRGSEYRIFAEVEQDLAAQQ